MWVGFSIIYPISKQKACTVYPMIFSKIRYKKIFQTCTVLIFIIFSSKLHIFILNIPNMNLIPQSDPPSDPAPSAPDTGASKGTALVRFETMRDAERARNALHCALLGRGRRLGCGELGVKRIARASQATQAPPPQRASKGLNLIHTHTHRRGHVSELKGLLTQLTASSPPNSKLK